MKIPDSSHPATENKLALRRRSLGLQQADLARRCAVSRQFLSQLESGKAQPNVQVALQLAAELGCLVEDLFEPVSRNTGGIPVSLFNPGLGEGARLDLALVNGRWVGHAVDTASSLGSGFAEADAQLRFVTGQAQAFVHRSPQVLEGNIAIAGCDPALALLKGAAGFSIPGRCFWVNCGSSKALSLLAEGWVHAAGLHYEGPDDDENLRQVRRVDPEGKWELLRFTRWEQGWMLRPEFRGLFRGAEDFPGGRLRLANREPGSGSRHWLDKELGLKGVSPDQVSGYNLVCESHWDCARRLLDGSADVAVGPKAIARAFGLEFIPFSVVAFDLVVPRAHLGAPRMQALLNRLRSREFQREIEALAGYSAMEAGARR